MKVILLVASIGVICQAAPGGYTAKGGVYKFGKQPSYMADAAHAGKLQLLGISCDQVISRKKQIWFVFFFPWNHFHEKTNWLFAIYLEQITVKMTALV